MRPPAGHSSRIPTAWRSKAAPGSSWWVARTTTDSCARTRAGGFAIGWRKPHGGIIPYPGLTPSHLHSPPTASTSADRPGGTSCALPHMAGTGGRRRLVTVERAARHSVNRVANKPGTRGPVQRNVESHDMRHATAETLEEIDPSSNCSDRYPDLSRRGLASSTASRRSSCTSTKTRRVSTQTCDSARSSNV